MGLREEKKERNRRIILDAAKQIFAANGYHRTSISDIIRQTELSRATFYLYFQNKTEIFNQLMTELFTVLFNDFRKTRDTIRSGDKSMKSVISRLSESLFITIHRHRDLVRIILNSPLGIDEEFDEVFQKHLSVLNNATMQVIQDATNTQGLEIESPTMVGSLLLGGIKEVVHGWLMADKFPDDWKTQVGTIARFYWGAFQEFTPKQAGPEA